MDLAIAIPVAAIVMGPTAWVANTWIRARHGYPLDDDDGNAVERSDLLAERKAQLMSAENEKLTGQVLRLEERIAVLERIATDPATRVSSEIERLR